MTSGPTPRRRKLFAKQSLRVATVLGVLTLATVQNRGPAPVPSTEVAAALRSQTGKAPSSLL